jgi:acetyl-CoA synthetase
MANTIQPHQLSDLGLSSTQGMQIAEKINLILTQNDAETAWHKISKNILSPDIPFAVHLFLFTQIYPEWPAKLDSAPACFPENDKTHLSELIAELQFNHFADFRTWSVTHHSDFLELLLKKMKIVFKKPYTKICDLSKGAEFPDWLHGAKINIADSCFTAPPTKTAIIFRDAKGSLQTISYSELNEFSNDIASSLIYSGFSAGDAIAIDMPMTANAVAIYLGIIKMGGIVVSIADSFSTEEIKTRLEIADTKAIFTQDFILRDTKKLPLYEKVSAANPRKIIVIPCEEKVNCILRTQDLAWNDFLKKENNFTSVSCDPMATCNILFSSGTTGTPKAIPWSHTTAIKAGMDAYLHQDIHPADILAWPTNLGWMMGPWLIFAALLNQATIALYDGLPRERKFGKFVQDAKVTMLGVVPTLVAAWRQSHCMEGLNWQSIKLFSSTGECSNPEDMLYLMSLAGYKPIIEYCGGTEIGGSYVTSTLVEKNYPSVFTTPALGLDFVLLDEKGKLTDNGEVALIPPALGLSTRLLNADHHKIYFANMPTTQNGKMLRRHGDQLCRLSNGTYSILGRIDDTMNLGAIKVSSAEIERVLAGIDHIIETAAIAVAAKGQGPSQLVIYAATSQQLDKTKILKEMQMRINQHLNPLFKIHDIAFVTELPKTASNKIMRRTLRDQYQSTF